MLNQKPACTSFCACVAAVLGETTGLGAGAFQIIELVCSVKSTGKDMATPLILLLVLFMDKINFTGGIGWYMT